MTMKMRLFQTTLALGGALIPMPDATTTTASAPDAQAQRSSDDWCRDQGRNYEHAGFCEVRELTVPTSGSLSVDASPNGGIKVEGAPRSDVFLRARIVAAASSEERARQIASEVRVQPSGDRIEAEGPQNLARREWWQVSYELLVPMQMSLSLKTVNGGLSVKGVEGRIEATTTNGGVRLTDVAGDVRGRTTNGGIDVDLDGTSWRGEGLDVQTSNGGVRVAIPDGYSARLEAATVNGGLNSDFPVMLNGRRSRNIEATLGGGGAPIRVRTSNGGVRITRK
jgi:hypothetical protein